MAFSGAGIELEAGDTKMRYKRINVEIIVVADEAEAVVAELNVALDRLEDSHTLFGGEIETAKRSYSTLENGFSDTGDFDSHPLPFSQTWKMTVPNQCLG
jgi:hypothetical protein